MNYTLIPRTILFESLVFLHKNYHKIVLGYEIKNILLCY